MDRKHFLITSGLTAIGLSTLGFVSKTADGTFSGDCKTTKDILGPYFRPDAPFRSDLTIEGDTGSVIELSGTVYQKDCVSPLENALVEIWHCDANGAYDNDTDEYRYRASARSDENGQYQFRTIIPGKYLNGALYRPSHIHFRVTAEDHSELISQIYFQGDPHIEKDPWASNERAERRILAIHPKETEGYLAVVFNINMA